MRSQLKYLATMTAGLMAFAAASSAGAQLYAADNLTDDSLHGVVAFDSGLGVTGTFLTDGRIAGIAASSTSVYVSLPDGISQYTTTGGLVNSYANIGVDHFDALAYTGTTLLAADNLTDDSLHGVVLFNSALQVTGSFLTDSAIAGLATDGTDIFASLETGVYKYSMSGTLLGSYLNIGVDSFGALSWADGILYAADNLTDGSLNGVVKFDADFGVVGTFLTNGAIAGLAADGTNVYASLPDGVARYTADGTLVSMYDNIGIDKFGPLALAPSAVPEPATWSLLIFGFGATGAAMRRRSTSVKLALAA